MGPDRLWICRISPLCPWAWTLGTTWKNGEFVFKDASLDQVIDELARWYNVEMVYDHSLFRESRVHIYMNRSQTLDEALDMLSKAWNIRYERQGTKVWLGERHTGGTDSD